MLGIVIIVFLAIILIWGIKINPKDFYDNNLSLEHSKSIKGILSIMIFLNHFSGWFINIDPVLYVLEHCGTFMVGLFFFLSAYGLSKTYFDGRKAKWTFLVKRFIKVLIPYWLCEIVYIVVSITANIPIKVDVTIKNSLLSAVTLSEIVENSWYVGAILFLYVVLFVSSKIFTKVSNGIKVSVIMIAYSVFISSSWITSFFAFPLGLIISEYDSFVSFIKKKYYLKLLTVIVLTFASIGVKYYGDSIANNTLMDLSDAFSSVLFSLLVFMLTFKVQIGNVILQFLSKISYEFYLMHGLCIRIAYRITGLEKPLLFFIISIGLTVVISYIVNFVAIKIDIPIIKKLTST